MHVPTFEQLPKVIFDLCSRVNNIELLLRASHEKDQEVDQLLTIGEAATFLSLAKPTIYGLVSRNDIPYSKKGKRLYFSSIDLKDWIRSGRNKTSAEIAAEADEYLPNRKRR